MEEDSFVVGGHDQSGEVSEMEPNSKNPTDMDADIEVEDEEKNVEVKRWGKTKLLQVWNIPRGHRIVVHCNELDQPIGEEAGIMGKFLGMVARNGNLCSLSYKDWRLLIGKKERLTNEQKNKEDILKQVKREKDPEKKYPHRAILYIHTHKANPTKNTNPHVGCLDDLPVNQFQTSSKLIFHQRVYVEPQNQEFRMDNEKTYSQREQEAKEYEDLQPTFRKTSTIHKVLCYLITHLSRFHGIMQTLIICIELKKIKVADTRQGKLQRTDRLATTHKTRQFELERDITFDNTKLANSSKSMTKEATSTSLNEEASKNQGTLGDQPTDESILTGAQVFLKSWRCPTKTVALGTVLGRDPNHKVGGVKLGREFWMVRVRLVILPIEPLIRPYDNMEVIGDVGNNLIAWPSCCV
ncbi:hypothetical protein ZEAMMB73_Zm00001d044809 [Zea mays]|uniref:Transposase Tnp1/En/Spm-like domain-containing protein n=1 Tax=Zea mays TaxID=4577 RepID=A0A1D6NRI0_MAIZE|nr:hypothetical protein ZEAMMB73_Zm00001d044809 [Zea mays]